MPMPNEGEPIAKDPGARAAAIERRIWRKASCSTPTAIAELLGEPATRRWRCSAAIWCRARRSWCWRSAADALAGRARARWSSRHAESARGRELPAEPARPARPRAGSAARSSDAASGGAAALPAGAAGEPPATMTIIVHGAFAAGDTWWRPTGNFGRYVEEKTGDLYRGADFFRWSGGGFHPDRVASGRRADRMGRPPPLRRARRDLAQPRRQHRAFWPPRWA